MLSVMFGLPAAGLAMIHCAKDKNRNNVKALIVAGIAASILTGITEPLEFTFMFISPILFLFHVIVYGFGFMIMDLLGVAVGGVQAGLIDFTVFGLLRGMDTKWYLIIIVGIIIALVYYFGFRYIITKFNIMTPGREDDVEDEDGIPAVISDDKLSSTIVDALGGKINIVSIENCMTRLRVVVDNPNLINEKVLKDTGASGFVRPTKENIQIVYGLKVDQIASDVKAYLKSI